MLSRIIFLLPVVFLMPTLNMRWVGSEHRAISISSEGVDSRWEKCVESGLQARYRIEVKLCRGRGGWFDHCLDSVVTKRSLEKDPVSGMIKSVSDTIGDLDEPEALGVDNYQEALTLILAPIEIPLERLARSDPNILKKKNVFLSAQVISVCRGDVSPMLRRLSQFLSFGLLDLQDKSSGWVDFKIQ